MYSKFCVPIFLVVLTVIALFYVISALHPNKYYLVFNNIYKNTIVTLF